MRISDWSSDVCSSDLFRDRGAYGGKEWGVDEAVTRLVGEGRIRHTIVVGIWNTPKRLREYMPAKVFARLPDDQRDRKSVVSGKSVVVRVDLGGRRIIKKKKQ